MTPPQGCPLVALLTDFGAEDTYVGVMKGVIGNLAPQSRVVDISHGVGQGNLEEAAFKLWQSVPYFPGESIFVIVVDPGVGTDRRAVAVRWRHYYLIAPDNGILTYLTALAPMDRAVSLDDRRYHLEPVSSTFHGRDIFAPAGGHLAAGVALADLGSPVSQLHELTLPKLDTAAQGLAGEIVHIDRFGNLITSLGRLRASSNSLHLEPWLPSAESQEFKGSATVAFPDGMSLPLSSTFGDVAPGEPVAYLGSEALVEVAINGGSAADELQFEVGDPVNLDFRG